MTVSVTDQRIAFGLPFADTVAIELGARTSPKSYTVEMFGLDSLSVITFPYNPEGFGKTTRPVWADRNLPARNVPIFDFKRKDADRLSVRYLLQLDDPEQVTAFIQKLESAAADIIEVTGEPDVWNFLAGAFEFTGHISSLNIEWVRSTANGNADIADIQMEMTENAKGGRL